VNCSSCRASLPEGARFCSVCGQPVGGPTRLSWLQRTVRGQTTAIVVGVVALGAVTLLLLALLGASLAGGRLAAAREPSLAPSTTAFASVTRAAATAAQPESTPISVPIVIPTTPSSQTPDPTSTVVDQTPATPTPILTPTAVRILSEQEAVAAVLPGVVRVQAGSSVGSGIVLNESDSIGSKQVVLTNAHVVGVSIHALVQLSSGEQVEALVTRVDTTADLALLELTSGGAIPATLGDATELELGEPLLAIGYALDLRGGPSVTRGVFSAHRSDAYGIDYVQTDASINPGNSGGPLISLKGQVVGLNTFRVEGVGGRVVQGLGFAVSTTSIRQFLASAPIQSVPSPVPTAVGSAAVDAVRAFYQLVNQRAFPQAWARLSSGFHGTMSYDTWLAGYATTRFVYVTDAHVISHDGETATVAVTVVAVDEKNAHYVTQTFGGQWQLVVEGGAWRLDVGKIGVIQ
jgi:S1-C subfamily serine protease